MSDIAREAGCSQSTVSVVLNANRSVEISEETRARVLRIARRLGYERPPLRGLNARRPVSLGGHIAFVIDYMSTSPEAVVALSGVRQATEQTGNVVLVAETGNDPVLEPRTLEILIEHGVAAIIFACVFTREISLPEILKTTRVPVFLLNCYSRDLRHPAVVPGEIAGGQRATHALVKAGHRRIGTITGEPFMEATKDRLEGYRMVLATADIPFDPELVIEGDWSASAGFRGTEELLDLADPPTAIFCQNDRMAIGCYEALKGRGLSIPDDVSVIGFDDEEIARHLFPPLTSLVLPHRAMGRWTIEQFFHGVQQLDGKYPVTKLECPLVERDSIAPPKG
ncbi:MAG: substrate-binding domain-containing protein [Boseongicola sp. SB0675_bin_26]|nr:substrate-binding domain-containing protein [Boseongicola sp. SB0675_bin_26]